MRAGEKARANRKAFSVAVFLRNEGHVLLVRHKLLGKWLPVGGEVEPGETPLEAAKREAREETGIDPVYDLGFATCFNISGAPDGLIGYEEHDAGPKGMHMCFSFLAESRTRRVVSDGSWDQYVWVEAKGDAKGVIVNPMMEIERAYPELGKATIPFNVLQYLVYIATQPE